MNDETAHDYDLRRRLQAADPASTNASADSWIPELVEATMNETTTTTETQTERRTRPWMPLAAAAALAAVVGGGYLAFSAGSENPDRTAAAPTSVELVLPASDAMNMCMMFDVATLGQAPVAFSGTVDSVAAGTVTLDVDRWYQGGDADRVVLENVGAATQVALDGVDFRPDQRYLVSATDGTVNTCGYSGPWTEDFAAQFGAAFGS